MRCWFQNLPNTNHDFARLMEVLGELVAGQNPLFAAHLVLERCVFYMFVYVYIILYIYAISYTYFLYIYIFYICIIEYTLYIYIAYILYNIQ